MTVRLVAAAVAVVVAGIAGPAHADTFSELPASPTAPAALPSADVPNAEGSLLLPPGWTAAPSAPAASRSFAELQALWGGAGEAYGIPWQVLAAINKIETNFGGNMGPSSAGAVGWMQFMPDTWLRWGLDANGDGVADPWNAEDAVYAAARYLAAAGGRTDLERGVFAYNHADWYVRDVLELAGEYGGGVVPEVTFAADRLQLEIQQAEAVVAAQEGRIADALLVVRRLAKVERRLLTRADRARLLSDELALRRQAGAAGVKRAAAEAVVASLQLGLGEAEAALAAAQTSNVTAYADPAAAAGAGPVYSGSYVFPVGGGPTVASVSHHHHDYPAADIAAPQGTPVYALADALVDRSWRYDDGRCGIGATITTADGQSWTYCHLSYLDPAVEGGTMLPAGALVGLVGSTGRSTGPHLHLQLNPATSYPQDQDWFRSFEGTAYSWQDEDPGRVDEHDHDGPVFAVVAEDAPAPDALVTFTR
jgi:murein DD-endopeptidase MepM/ murein hydrolase activator NlpD